MNNSTTEREVSAMYYTQEQIDRANQADLVSFLQSQGEQLTRAGNEYRWKRHDSLTVRGNKWYTEIQEKLSACKQKVRSAKAYWQCPAGAFANVNGGYKETANEPL